MQRTDLADIETTSDRHLTVTEYALFAWLSVRAAIVLAALPLALRYLTVARVVRLLTPHRQGTTQRPALLWRSTHAVDWLASKRPFRFWGYCLRRSLLLYFVATRTGYPVSVVVGVRREGSGVTGHAWLELNGCPVLEPGDHPEYSFVVMERLPGNGTPAS